MLIEYRSGLISLFSLDARLTFTRPYSDDCRGISHQRPRSHARADRRGATRPRPEPPRANRTHRRAARRELQLPNPGQRMSRERRLRDTEPPSVHTYIATGGLW